MKYTWGIGHPSLFTRQHNPLGYKKTICKMKNTTTYKMIFTLFVVSLLQVSLTICLECPVSYCSCDSSIGTIDCSNRGLTTVPTKDFGKLQFDSTFFRLNLSGNSIDYLAEAAFGPARFREIDLRRNPLRKGFLNARAFIGLETILESLFIGSNSQLADYLPDESDLKLLRLLSNLNLLEIEGFRLNILKGDHWQHLTSLKKLVLDGCRIVIIQSGAFVGFANSLKHFEITKDPYLTQIPTGVFHVLTALQYFSLAHNRLQRIELTGNDILPPNIETLHLQNNVLTEINFGNQLFLQMKTMILANNSKINWSSFRYSANMPNLVDLNLENTGIRAINFEIPNNAGLKRLNLGDNFIKQIPSGLANLEWLNLIRNDFNKLESSQLYQLGSLREIDLSENYNLTDLQTDSLTVRNNATIHLRNCKITGQVNEQLSSTWDLIYSLDLTGNPITCNCSTISFLLSDEKILISIKGKCITPIELKGVDFASIPDHPSRCQNESERISSALSKTSIIIIAVCGAVFFLLLVALFIIVMIIRRRSKRRTYEPHESMITNVQQELLLDVTDEKEEPHREIIFGIPIQLKEGQYEEISTRPPNLPPRPRQTVETNI